MFWHEGNQILKFPHLNVNYTKLWKQRKLAFLDRSALIENFSLLDVLGRLLK